MLFRPEHVKMILEGKKTATRRVWKFARVIEGHVYKAKTKMLSKESFANLYILRVYKQKLKRMTEKDANKEGYPTMDAFKKVWESINGFWNENLEVYVVEFKLVKENAKCS